MLKMSILVWFGTVWYIFDQHVEVTRLSKYIDINRKIIEAACCRKLFRIQCNTQQLSQIQITLVFSQVM